LQTGKIIAGAKTIVGVDNGLLHVAGCTNIPIVGGYTSVDPEHRMPYRNNIMGWNYYPVVPPESEPEKFFQSRYDFIMEHDYRKSYLGNDSLIKSLTPELYINELEKIL
jgi:ADP-heptose:LPS heptosyltransferase